MLTKLFMYLFIYFLGGGGVCEVYKHGKKRTRPISRRAWLMKGLLYGFTTMIGSLSNDDGNAKENVTQKTNFTFLKLLRCYPN